MTTQSGTRGKSTAGSAFAPAAVLSIDVTDVDAVGRLITQLDSSPYGRAQVLVRMCGEPLGIARVSREQLARPESVVEALQSVAGRGEHRHGHRAFDTASSCAWRDGRAARRGEAVPISVIICTSGRPERLRGALETVAALNHPDFELILVDNAPRDTAAREILESFEHRLDAYYVIEPIPGLARARNTGLMASRHRIVAYTDDDVILHPDWLWAVQEALRSDPRVGVVSGPVLPAELETQAQEWFELQGGHSKLRGFGRFVFSADDAEQSPMYPLPPFGVGCNMSFRRSALLEVGGFDPALGAGTPSRAGEDTAVISELMLRGWRTVWEASTVMWHFHRATMGDLHAQRRGYGVGLGAYYASLLAHDPRRIWPLLKLVPMATMAIARPQPLGTDAGGKAAVTSSAIQRRALLYGPPAYFRSRRQAAARTGSAPRPAAGVDPVSAQIVAARSA